MQKISEFNPTLIPLVKLLNKEKIKFEVKSEKEIWICREGELEWRKYQPLVFTVYGSSPNKIDSNRFKDMTDLNQIISDIKKWLKVEEFDQYKAVVSHFSRRKNIEKIKSGDYNLLVKISKNQQENEFVRFYDKKEIYHSTRNVVINRAKTFDLVVVNCFPYNTYYYVGDKPLKNLL